MQQIIFSCHAASSSITNLCFLTSIIESIHRQYPGKFLTDIRTSYPAIIKNNPFVEKLLLNDAEIIELNSRNSQPPVIVNSSINHLLRQLNDKFNIKIDTSHFKPNFYLSPEEESWSPPIPTPYWIVICGTKSNNSTKDWYGYQQIIDKFKGEITFVQMGLNSDTHIKLKDTIDMVGQTNLRELMLWVSKCQSALGSYGFLQSLCYGFNKSYFCIGGGSLVNNPRLFASQQLFHTIGQLSCCKLENCCRKYLNNDTTSYCVNQIELNGGKKIAKCMESIKPIEVIFAINRFLSNLK